MDRPHCSCLFGLGRILARDDRGCALGRLARAHGHSSPLNLSTSAEKKTMPRSLYSPRLSDDVVRALYREGQRRRKPMTVVADELLRNALADALIHEPVSSVAENSKPRRANPKPGVA